MLTNLLIWLGGFVGGIMVSLLFDVFTKTHGVIEIDHNDYSCRVHMTSKEITNPKTKKAIFKIDHDADFSRNEQGL